MTGDWTSAVSVQILRRVDFSEVPVVVLNDVKLIVNIFDDVDIFLPDTSDRICSRRDSPAPCQLGASMIETRNYYRTYN